MSEIEQNKRKKRALPENPRVLLVAPSLRIMGGQAVQAERLLSRMRSDGRNVDLLPINPELPGVLRWAERVKYLRTLVVSFFYILSLLRRVPQYDVIHVFSASYFSFVLAPTPAILISYLFGKPIALNYRSGEAADHLTRWRRTVFPVLRLVDQIVVPSGYLVDVFGSFGFHAVDIPNIVDGDLAAHAVRKSSQPKIIVARALEELYNISCSIRAFALVQEKYPRAEMTVLGYGSQEQALKAQVTSMRLSGVRFTGRVEREEIGAHYAEHDLFLNSSSIDNMPVSILEAFAAGLPIVTTDAGGIPYIITDRENGHMVAVDDHVALAERVIELVERPEEVARLSELGSEEIKRYRWEAVAEQWTQLYQSVIHKHLQPRKPRGVQPVRSAETKSGRSASELTVSPDPVVER